MQSFLLSGRLIGRTTRHGRLSLWHVPALSSESKNVEIGANVPQITSNRSTNFQFKTPNFKPMTHISRNRGLVAYTCVRRHPKGQRIHLRYSSPRLLTGDDYSTSELKPRPAANKPVPHQQQSAEHNIRTLLIRQHQNWTSTYWRRTWP